jgi:hypothetical protein
MSEQVILRVTVEWWLRPYLFMLSLFCRLHGTQPDQEKLRRVCMRGISVHVE